MTRKARKTASVPKEVYVPFRDSETQIRLVRLCPDSRRLSGTLETWDRDSAPPFNAISYVWGFPLPQKTIYINGKPFPVGRNCHYALYQARLHHPVSYVWVDAICVNQQDLEEKAAQVASMGVLYGMASRVLACVGLADANSDILCSVLEDPDAALQNVPLHESYPYSMDIWAAVKDEASTVTICNAFTEFSHRPYFNRVWIIQELYGGGNRTSFLCGQHQIDCADLKDIGIRLEDIFTGFVDKPYKGEYDRTLLDIFSLFPSVVDPQTEFMFPKYLETMLRKQCKDPRDRVYGTLSLIDWGAFGQTPPTPNYQKSPVQLALELLGRTFDLSLENVFHIMGALEIWRFPGAIEALYAASADMTSAPLQVRRGWFLAFTQTLHEKRLSNPANFQNTIDDESLAGHRVARKWTAAIAGANIAQRDEQGRLQVGFVRDASCSMPPPDRANVSDSDIDVLAARGLVWIFTDEQVCALATKDVQPGDIIIRTVHCGLAIRPCHDARSFTIVGGVIISPQFAARWRTRDGCECWDSAQEDDFQRKRITLAFELTNEEAVKAAWLGNDFGFEQLVTSVEDVVVDYLVCHSFGAVKAGSLCFDVTAGDLDDDRIIGPVHPQCTLHRSAELHRRSRNALWYNLLTDAGGEVHVTTGKPCQQGFNNVAKSDGAVEPDREL